MKPDIPKEVRAVAGLLEQRGFEAYLVGGCVRDLLLKRAPKDWDITTNATPQEIQEVFSSFAGATEDKPATVYENEFGTVGVKTDSDDPALKIVEVTTYRTEGRYTDKRHPDEVRFAKTVEEDLSRRDFTMNAIAMQLDGDLADPYGGQQDIKKRIVRTVGKPEDRFDEDALRLLRAARLATELDFQIDMQTRRAIEAKAGLLEAIAKERIRDEFAKLIMSERAATGVILLEELNLLRNVLPELRDGLGVGQNLHHIYTVFEHNVRALDYAAKQGYSLAVRLASLLHDLGKPKAKRGEGKTSTFYGHEVVGARMAVKALDRLHFGKDLIDDVVRLIRYHMFFYNVDEVSAAGVRRFIARVGVEHIDELLQVREADRIGSGVPKAVPYKMRHLKFMIDKVRRDPVSPKMLAVKGEDVMRIARIEPGPKVGQILAALLDEVLDDPKKNDKKHMEKRVAELAKLSAKELEALRAKSREKQEEFESGIEEEMKRKHYVK
jgi:tRNA nucleotidyltransferase (CCA-adding enzyme)